VRMGRRRKEAGMRRKGDGEEDEERPSND
jgi:hypothetical protein